MNRGETDPIFFNVSDQEETIEPPRVAIDTEVGEEEEDPKVDLDENLLKMQQEFLDRNIDYFRFLIGNKMLNKNVKFKPGHGFKIVFKDPITIYLDQEWWKRMVEGQHSEEEMLFATMHEISHYIDLINDPEGLLGNFNENKETAIRLAPEFKKIWMEAYSQRGQKWPVRASEKFVKDFIEGQLNRFYNALDDVYVNNIVRILNPHRYSKDYGSYNGDVERLYQEHLFPEGDLRRLPKSKQLGYAILRSAMVTPKKDPDTGQPIPESHTIYCKEVEDILNEKIRINGHVIDIRSGLEKLLRPSGTGVVYDKDYNKNYASHRYLVIKVQLRLEKKFLELLREDLKTQEIPETPDGKSQNQQDDNNEDSDEGEGGAEGSFFNIGDKVREKTSGKTGKVVEVKGDGAVVVEFDDDNQAPSMSLLKVTTFKKPNDELILIKPRSEAQKGKGKSSDQPDVEWEDDGEEEAEDADGQEEGEESDTDQEGASEKTDGEEGEEQGSGGDEEEGDGEPDEEGDEDSDGSGGESDEEEREESQSQQNKGKGKKDNQSKDKQSKGKGGDDKDPSDQNESSEDESSTGGDSWFDYSQTDPIDEKTIRDYIEARDKAAEEAKQGLYDEYKEKLSPEQIERDHRIAQDTALILKYNSEGMDSEEAKKLAEEWETYAESTRPLVRELNNVFQQLINTIQEKIIVAWETGFKTGKFDVKKFIKKYSPQVVAGDLEDNYPMYLDFNNLEAFMQREFTSKLRLVPNTIVFRLMMDRSGSMNEENKIIFAKEIFVLLYQALKMFESRVNSLFKLKEKFQVDLEVQIYDHETVIAKPLGVYGEEERARMLMSLGVMVPRGSTYNAQSWRNASNSIMQNPQYQEKLKNGQAKDIAIEVTDGQTFDNIDEVQKIIRNYMYWAGAGSANGIKIWNDKEDGDFNDENFKKTTLYKIFRGNGRPIARPDQLAGQMALLLKEQFDEIRRKLNVEYGEDDEEFED